MLTPERVRQHGNDFAEFVATAPSSYHAAASVAGRLREAGFVEQDERQPWDGSPGGHFLVRDGAVVAWRVPDSAGAHSCFRIVGAHTDSPTFKLKPQPTFSANGYQQVAVEVYGGPLLNSWLDRELGIAGRVSTDDGEMLVQTGPLMRIPQLAIHLDRGVNDGLKLDKQRHTQPIFSLGEGRTVLGEVAQSVGIGAHEIRGHDLYAYAVQPPEFFGADEEFIASPRMDNLTSVHAGLVALLGAKHLDQIAVLACFDHEEVGSASTSGAEGPLLGDVLHRIALSLGATPDEVFAMMARSTCVSADAGHAVHPNYANHHDPTHHPVLGGGPLLKINANQRYASDAVGEALWRRACDVADVETQAFVSNNTMPCGSTIGPLTATRLGIRVVDVGPPLLSMHSAREMAAVSDLRALTEALGAYFVLD